MGSSPGSPHGRGFPACIPHPGAPVRSLSVPSAAPTIQGLPQCQGRVARVPAVPERRQGGGPRPFTPRDPPSAPWAQWSLVTVLPWEGRGKGRGLGGPRLPCSSPCPVLGRVESGRSAGHARFWLTGFLEGGGRQTTRPARPFWVRKAPRSPVHTLLDGPSSAALRAVWGQPAGLVERAPSRLLSSLCHCPWDGP